MTLVRQFALRSAAFGLLVIGASAHAAGADVIAQGGAVQLGSADVRALVAALPAAQRDSAVSKVENLDQLLRQEVLRRALLAEAHTQGFERTPDAAAQLDRIRDEALMRLWIASRAAVPKDFPSEDEIKMAYEANKQALAAPTSYRLAQIFISAPDGIEPARFAVALKKTADIGARIATTDFDKLAQEQSEQPESAAKGGDLGYLTENQLLPEVLAAVRTLKLGDTAGPVKTGRGLHFFKLLDKKAGAVPTLAEAHERLAAALRERRARELQQAYLTQLNTKLAVSVNQIELAKLQASLH
jgi:peptidylprolyl isomerase